MRCFPIAFALVKKIFGTDRHWHADIGDPGQQILAISKEKGTTLYMALEFSTGATGNHRQKRLNSFPVGDKLRPYLIVL